MRGKRTAAVLMIFMIWLGVTMGVAAEEQSNSQHTQKVEKAATKNSQTTGEPMQPFQPSKEISADSVISLPTDI